MRFILLSFLVLILGLQSANAQSTYEFLRVDMSTRAAALGGSYVASGDDAEVMFYNPAGLKLLSGMPVSFSYVNYLMDINFASFSVAKELDESSVIGASVKYANYGTFTKADDFGNKSGDYSANEVAIAVGYAGVIDENFYYGANVKFIYSGIESYSSTAAAVDLGVYYSIPSQKLNFGLSLMNVGSQLSSYVSQKESLPTDLTAGVSKKLEYLPLRLFLDFHRIQESNDGLFDRFKNFSFGAEFTLSKVLQLRVGYENEKRRDLKIGTFAGLAGFNMGLGVTIKEYIFNYAYSSMGQIGALHRIGINSVF